MKKFEINKTAPNHWIVSHNEFPKFTCLFENKKFNLNKTVEWLTNPESDLKEVSLLQRMEKWLSSYHADKIEEDHL